MWRKTAITIAMLVIGSGIAIGGTAAQYRGPAGENPIAIAAPSTDGPIGTERLVSRGRDIDGPRRWEFWWELNRDRFLRMAAGRNIGTVSGGAMASIWGGAERQPAWVEESEVRLKIVGALLPRLASRNEEERGQAAIALGKTRVSAAFGPLRKLLENGSPADRRAASLALGYLGEPAAVPLLAGYLSRIGVPPAERAFAAIGLGILGSPESATVLERALGRSLAFRGSGIVELQVAAATALGVLGQDRSADLLARVAGTKNGIDGSVRASALVALGRINAERSLPVLLAGLGAGDVELRRAAAQALGQTRRADANGKLLTAFLKDPDLQVRNFAAMSMARIGGPNVANALLGGLHRTNSRSQRGFVALALGVLGDRRVAPALRKILAGPDERSLLGASAIALGIMGDGGSMPVLRQIARNEARSPDLRGYAVLALAMLGDTTTMLSLPATLQSGGEAPLRRSAALALGLSYRLRAGPAVLKALFTDQDDYVRGAVVNSLALLPRRSVLGTLMDVVKGDGFGTKLRIDAVVALGALAARGRPSPMEELLDGMNYRSTSNTLSVAASLL